MKKILALITSLAIVFSSLTFTVFATDNDEFIGGTGDTSADSAAAEAVWSGEIATKLAGGTGTEADPYLITTAEQLAFFASTYTQLNSANKYFKLTNDIYLNALTEDGFSKTNEWVNSQESFGGHLDGNGYIIYGLYVPESRQATYAGLIPLITAGTGSIKNLGISNAEVYGVASGAVLGAVSYIGTSFVIDNCFADKTVILNGTFVGGIAGMLSDNIQKLTISNCYFTGSVGTGANKGGLIGYIGSNSINNAISNCYVATADNNTVTGNTALAQNYSSVYTTAESDGTGVTLITKENLSGVNAKNNTTLDFLTAWNLNENGLPTLKVFAEKTENDLINPGNVWNGGFATRLAGGTGTEADPYLIGTAEQLAFFASNYTQINSADRYFKLTNDIYLNELTEDGFSKTNEWVNSQQNFGGHLDGDGHIVYGLYVPAGSTFGGLIPLVVSGTGSIKNIGIGYADINAVAAGAVVGSVSYVGTSFVIDNCFADETVILDGTFVGGMAGMLSDNVQKLTISNCYFTGSVGTGANKGGLIGYIGSNSINNAISNCYVATADNNTVTGNTALTQNYSSVYSTAESDGTGVTLISKDNLSGINAKANTSFDFINTWHINKNGYPTLFVFDGHNDDSEAGKVWDGSTSTEFAGGTGTEADPYLITTAEQLAFFASNYNQVNSADKYFKLTDNIYLNSLTEDGFSKTNEWVNSQQNFGGHLDGDGHIVYGLYVPAGSTFGGLIPLVVSGTGSIKNIGIGYADINAVAAGAVVGSVSYVGTSFVIDNCFADESVTLGGDFVGGMAGMLSDNVQKLTISNCYFTGSVGTGANKGGLIGYIGSNSINNTISNCYVATADNNTVTGNTALAQNYSSVYSTADSDSVNVTLVEGINIIGEKAAANMSGFDFENVWTVAEGTPVLKAFVTNGYDGQGRYFYDIYDINTDKEVNILDIIRIKRIIAKDIEGTADLNADGLTNSEDTVILKKILLGVETA